MPHAVSHSQGDHNPFPKIPDDNQYALRTIWEHEMGQKSIPVKHDKTSVLMLSFNPDDDDLSVSNEVNTLADVLRRQYRYKVENKTLSTKEQASPQAQAFKHLSDFVYEEDDHRSLLIVYYAGHGWSRAEDAGKIRLSGKSPSTKDEADNHSIDWTEVERVFVKTKADVFVIFDCCHAGLLCKPAHRDNSRCFQYLGACAASERTKAPGKHSFTAAMTHAFNELATRPGFSVNELVTLVQKAPNFPPTQHPQLYGGRFEPSIEYIYMAPAPVDGESPVLPHGEYRDEAVAKTKAYEFLDLRFFFEKKITEDQLKAVARELHPLLHHHRKFECLKVSFVRKASVSDWANIKWKEVMEYFKSRSRSYSSTPIDAPLSAPRKGSRTNLRPPLLQTRNAEQSDADTIAPSPISEATPLIPRKAYDEPDQTRPDNCQDEEIWYHLKVAGVTLGARSRSWALHGFNLVFPCFQRRRRETSPV